MNKEITFLLEQFDYSETNKPFLKLKLKNEDFSLFLNNFSDEISSLFNSYSIKNTSESSSLLEILQKGIVNEKSDVLKQEYLNFLIENLSFFSKDIDKLLEFNKMLLENLRENFLATNPLYKTTLVKAITNIMIFCELPLSEPFFHEYLDILMSFMTDSRQNQFIKGIVAQSIMELESFYPNLMENEILKHEPERLKESTVQKAGEKKSDNIDLLQMNQALSLRNYSLIEQNFKRNNKFEDLSLFELYKKEKGPHFADLLLLLLEIATNILKRQIFALQNPTFKTINNKNAIKVIKLLNKNQTLEKYLNPKLLDLIKKLISHIIADLNLLSFFTKMLVLEKLSLFLNVASMSAKVILPLFASMLKSQGNVFVLANLKILEQYNDELDEPGRTALVHRLFSDLKDEMLSIPERTVIIYWLVNLKSYYSYSSEIQKDNKNFNEILMSYYWDILPKPNDNYILKEKKILAFLTFCENNPTIEPSSLIKIVLNFQIFKQFTITSDIVSMFFRIIFVCIEKLPFTHYLSAIADLLFEVLQHKPKFSANAIELFQKIGDNRTKNDMNNLSKNNEIYTLFLTGFSNYLLKLEPSKKISHYCDLINFVIEEPLIDPHKILQSVFRLVQSIDESLGEGNRYKINENVLFICKKTLQNYSFEQIADILLEIFSYLTKKSLDFAIKDRAELYKSLLQNLQKHKLNKIFNSTNPNQQIFAYNTIEKINFYQNSDDFLNKITLRISYKERKNLGLYDDACAIFGDSSLIIENKIQKVNKFSNFANFLNLGSFSNQSFPILLNQKNIDHIISLNDVINILTKKKNLIESGDIIDGKESDLISLQPFSDNDQILEDNIERELSRIKPLLSFLKIRLNYFSSARNEIIYFLKKKILSLFFLQSEFQPQIIIPLELNSCSIHIYSLTIIFANSENFEEIPSIFVPFLSFEENLKYKILLRLKIKNPVPMEIETGLFFTKSDEKIFLAKNTQLFLKFEDMFLPIQINQKIIESFWNMDENKEEAKLLINLSIFEELWGRKTPEATKILKNTKENILKLIDCRLKYFCIHEPIRNNEEILKILNDLFGGLYNEKENFDFEFEKEQENGESEEIYICPVLIFLPDKYYLCFKIAIHDRCSLVRIKTNRWEILKQIDKYFEFWNKE